MAGSFDPFIELLGNLVSFKSQLRLEEAKARIGSLKTKASVVCLNVDFRCAFVS